MRGQLPERGKSPLADAIRDAIGASDEDIIEFVTPQFARPANWPQPQEWAPCKDDFEVLRKFPMKELMKMGFGNWDGGLALIPVEWKDQLPDGLVLETIGGTFETVGVDEIDTDCRYGMLAYGIRVGPPTDGE